MARKRAKQTTYQMSSPDTPPPNEFPKCIDPASTISPCPSVQVFAFKHSASPSSVSKVFFLEAYQFSLFCFDSRAYPYVDQHLHHVSDSLWSRRI
jgi:hypothetical protein